MIQGKVNQLAVQKKKLAESRGNPIREVIKSADNNDAHTDGTTMK